MNGSRIFVYIDFSFAVLVFGKSYLSLWSSEEENALWKGNVYPFWYSILKVSNLWIVEMQDGFNISNFLITFPIDKSN